MRGAADIIRSKGVAIEPLLKQVEIPLAALHDEELRISLPAYAKLLENASRITSCPDLGLTIAEHQDISILGPLAIAMQNASTIAEALHTASRFLHVHSNGIRFSTHSESSANGLSSLRMTLTLPPWQQRVQLMEQCLTDMHHFVSFLAAEELPIKVITLPHQPSAEIARYQHCLGTPLKFDQPHAEVILPTRFLQKSLKGSVSALYQLSMEYLETSYESSNATVSERVQDVLDRALSSTRGNRDLVAPLLHLHPRTLQRRLKAEGTSFTQLVDYARREQAKRWLTESTVPLAYVADIVGFADQTVLTRSCKRWFNCSPAVIRHNGLPQDKP